MTISFICQLCPIRNELNAQIISFSKKIESKLVAKDQLTILPSSVIINTETGSRLNDEDYKIYNDEILLTDSIFSIYHGAILKISYRTFNFNIGKSYSHLDSTVMDTVNTNFYIGYTKQELDNNIINVSDLNYNGSFSRGFSVGNAQSLNLNSNFNLQLSGDLGYGINVTAAISDDNIPIQPQGNTQLLQEFDRVFIKVSKDKSSIIAGDFQLKRPKGYFTNYLKKLKGLYVENVSTLGSTILTSDASVAVSRGKFARQILSTTEGNQGPYKLNGNNGERFLIVLSGTEKVYLDGKLLKRGFNYDYIIDYNRAEVVFSPSVLVRRESRIIVEFEYTDQNYLRTLYSANNYLKGKRWSANINFYNEQDSKTATGDIVLDSTDIMTLSLSGDDPSLAIRDGVFSLQDTNRVNGLVTYIRLPNNNPDDSISEYILEYSDNPTKDLVRASFTEVGLGNGTYVIDDSTAVNGRVYKYVGPGQGIYLPEIRLTAPEKKQMVSMGASYDIFKEGVLSGELSFTNNDKNRYSDIDNEDNQGFAGMISYDQTVRLDSSWRVKPSIIYEKLGSNYLPLNPYRNAEFTRDWNIDDSNIKGAEDLIFANIELSHKDSFSISYGLNHYKINNFFDGTKHSISSNYMTKIGTKLHIQSSILNSKLKETETSNFSRLYANAEQILHKNSGLVLGLSSDIERNERRASTNLDTLNSNSRAYERYDTYLKNNLRNNLQFKLGYSYRVDRSPLKEVFAKAIETHEYSLSTLTKLGQNHTLNILASYRDFEVDQNDPTFGNQSSKKTIIGKLDHNINFKNGFLIANTLYSTSSGQQPKVEFRFVQVPEGQGDYRYDGNPDSTELSINFRYDPESGIANYRRISEVNGEFISTNNLILSHSLRLSPQRLWSQDISTKWQRLISRFSTISTIRIDKRVEASDGPNYLNFKREEAGLVQYNGLVVNSLFINKGKKAFDIQLTRRNSTNIFTQISGLERRTDDRWELQSRVKVGRLSDLLFEVIRGDRSFNSETFNTRNFNIQYHKISPKFSLRPNDYLRIIFDYSYDFRKGKYEIINSEDAKSHEFALDFNYRKPSILSLSSRISFVSVVYNPEPNSPFEFDLLRGLKDGRNYLWNANITRRLNDYLDITLSYEGRKNGISPTVHIARAQAKATF